MEHFKTCRFCNIVEGKYHYTGIDEPFASNEEFIAVASIGALVEGWSLIIPKAHQLSMRSIYANSMFADFVGSVLHSLVNKYGPLLAFEHGANKEDSITACGTDHAHLHLVPFGESLLPELHNSGLQWIKCRTSEINFHSGVSEYLFFTELGDKEIWHDPVGYLHVLKYPIAQFFRCIIARRRGNSEVSDYNRFPYLDTARQTRRVLTGSFA